MDIQLENIGKRFGFEWIFRGINYSFQAGQTYAVLGANGSGKSTLMKILSGHLSPTKGEIDYQFQGKKIPVSEVFQHISYAAPYIELIEDLSLKELLAFHARFRPFLQGMKQNDVIEQMQFTTSTAHRELKYYSSGMKQRVKLALAIFSAASVLLLDEPTTNLDTPSMDWYLSMIEQFGGDRMIIVATNEERDYSFCQHSFRMGEYKKR